MQSLQAMLPWAQVSAWLDLELSSGGKSKDSEQLICPTA